MDINKEYTDTRKISRCLWGKSNTNSARSQLIQNGTVLYNYILSLILIKAPIAQRGVIDVLGKYR